MYFDLLESPDRWSMTAIRYFAARCVVLYSLGVTIGAGIYVLLGASAGRAGIHAPIAFLLAAAAVLFSAISFAEMARRYPVSAGEAAYVLAGFGLGWLSTLVGLLVVAGGTVSCATIALGSTGYIREILDLPTPAILLAVILLLGAVAVWGITESVIVAGLFTIVEIGAIVAGLWTDPGIVAELPRVLPATPLPSPIFSRRPCSASSLSSASRTSSISPKR